MPCSWLSCPVLPFVLLFMYARTRGVRFCMRIYTCPNSKSSLCCWPQGRILVLHTRLSIMKTGEFVDRDFY